jgi:hypothetical protein
LTPSACKPMSEDQTNEKCCCNKISHTWLQQNGRYIHSGSKCDKSHSGFTQGPKHARTPTQVPFVPNVVEKTKTLCMCCKQHMPNTAFGVSRTPLRRRQNSTDSYTKTKHCLLQRADLQWYQFHTTECFCIPGHIHPQ